MLRQSISICILVIALELQGCASIVSLTHYRAGSSDPLVFGGTRTWIRNYSGESGSEGWNKAQLLMLVFPPLMLIPALDTPLSFVADAALLPVTLPWALSEELSSSTIAETFDQKTNGGLKPFDTFASEEGRFAASLQLPNDVPVDSGYTFGMSSRDYFAHLCKTEAGEFIYKSVDKVDGIFLMRPRVKAFYEHEQLYAPEDPLASLESRIFVLHPLVVRRAIPL